MGLQMAYSLNPTIESKGSEALVPVGGPLFALSNASNPARPKKIRVRNNIRDGA